MILLYCFVWFSASLEWVGEAVDFYGFLRLSSGREREREGGVCWGGGGGCLGDNRMHGLHSDCISVLSFHCCMSISLRPLLTLSSVFF